MSCSYFDQCITAFVYHHRIAAASIYHPCWRQWRRFYLNSTRFHGGVACSPIRVHVARCFSQQDTGLRPLMALIRHDTKCQCFTCAENQTIEWQLTGHRLKQKLLCTQNPRNSHRVLELTNQSDWCREQSLAGKIWRSPNPKSPGPKVYKNSTLHSSMYKSQKDK